MNWTAQRDINLAKRESAMAQARALMMESAVKINRTFLLFQQICT